MKCFYRGIKLINSLSKCYVPISVTSMIIQGIYTPISLYFLQQILNAVQDKKDIVWNYLAIYFVLAIVNILFERVYNLYSIKITKKFEKRIDILILEKTNSLNLSDYENLETYNIINRAQSQGGESIISYIKGYFDILKSFITVISSLELKDLPVFGRKLNIPAREMVLILLDIEKEYNITINDEDVNSYGFMTINKIIKIINNK